MESIWYRDILHFFSVSNLPKFYPTQSMTYTEQLNAIMRFSVYFSVIIFVVNRNILVFYIVVFIGLLTAFMYEMYNRNKRQRAELYNKLNIKYDKHQQRFCAKPTQHNPFMNILMNEYTEFPNRPPACNLNQSKIKHDAENFFEQNLYRDVDDIWTRKTSSRNWHTVPSTTIPSDRKAFTDWVYNITPSCKEGNGIQCHNNMYTNYKL